MNEQDFKKYLRKLTKAENISKSDWRYGLTAFWIKYFANYASNEWNVNPRISRIISIKYFKDNPKLSHDSTFNHGGLIDGNIKLMLYKNHLINKKEL